jgi:hypothetical protein
MNSPDWKIDPAVSHPTHFLSCSSYDDMHHEYQPFLSELNRAESFSGSDVFCRVPICSKQQMLVIHL